MVPEIEEFRAELDVGALRDVGLLEYCEVPVIDSLLSERSIDTRFVTEGPRVILHTRRFSAGSREASGVEPLREPGHSAAGDVLIASGDVVRPDRTLSEEARTGHRVITAPADLHWEAALECSGAVHAPAGDYLAGNAGDVAHEPLSMAERQIEDVAEYQALRDILRGKRTFASQVVPVLNRARAAGRAAFQPRREGIGIRHQLGIGVGGEEGAAALEPLGDGSLQGVVAAAAATLSIQVNRRVLRERPEKLADKQATGCGCGLGAEPAGQS